MGTDDPPFSTQLKQLLKAPENWGGGSAVQGLHIYGSVLGGAVGDGSEQRAGLLHRGSERDGCRGPMTIRGLRSELQKWGGLHFQLLRDLECWMSHCSVMSILSFSLQETE